MNWLLDTSTFLQLKEAKTASIEITPEMQKEYSTSLVSDSSRVLEVTGSVANINVSGVISNKPDMMAMFFGGGNVLWGEIQAALSDAEADSKVSEVVLHIDSGGGTVDGMFDTLSSIQTLSKPITAMVHNLAASAAFGLASQTDKIVVNNRAARIGSVGVVARFGVDDSSVSITSTEAPNKAPDVSTDEGKEVIVEELDALHDLFVESIASGRSLATDKKVTPAMVNANFGKGAVFLAEKALSLGMIDSILAPTVLRSSALSNKITATTNESNKITGDKMDLKAFKRDHNDLYEAVVQEGVAKERDRVEAHLIMGESTGSLDTAIKAVKEGQGMTETLKAQYMTAGMNKNDASARTADEEASASVLGNAAAKPPEATMGDTVASLVEDMMGV